LSLLRGSGASAGRDPPAWARKAVRTSELIKGANLALRFLLELCALGALGYWGFKTGGESLARIGLGVGAPLVAVVAWGVFVPPRRRCSCPGR